MTPEVVVARIFTMSPAVRSGDVVELEDPIEIEAEYWRRVAQVAADGPTEVVIEPTGDDVLPARFRIDRAWPADAPREQQAERRARLWPAPFSPGGPRWHPPTVADLRGLLRAANLTQAQAAAVLNSTSRRMRYLVSGRDMTYPDWIVLRDTAIVTIRNASGERPGELPRKDRRTCMIERRNCVVAVDGGPDAGELVGYAIRVGDTYIAREYRARCGLPLSGEFDTQEEAAEAVMDRYRALVEAGRWPEARSTRHWWPSDEQCVAEVLDARRVVVFALTASIAWNAQRTPKEMASVAEGAEREAVYKYERPTEVFSRRRS